MEDWKVENVSVNLHLTPEAAEILRQYAGDRNRGKFVSQLLVAQRQRDDLEAKEQRKARSDQKLVEKREAMGLSNYYGSKKKGRGSANGARR